MEHEKCSGAISSKEKQGFLYSFSKDDVCKISFLQIVKKVDPPKLHDRCWLFLFKINISDL